MGPGARQRFLAAIALTVIVALLLSGTARVTGAAINLSAGLSALTSPLEGDLTAAMSAVATTVGDLGGMWGAEGRLQTLMAENLTLRGQIAQMQASQYTLSQLRQILALSQQPLLKGKTVAASVVARAPDTWFDTVWIDRGSASGVAVGDAVLSVGGVVGRVLAVTPSSAVVILLADPQSAMGVIDARTGAAGVVLGQGRASVLQLQFFTGDAQVRQGDLVVTSGLGRPIPAGLLVGRISHLGKAELGLVRTATVVPHASLAEVETVLVLVK